MRATQPIDAPLRVLLLEDTETDAKLITRALRGLERAVIVERIQDAESMRRLVSERSWDVVLSDWAMPSFTALDGLAVLHALDVDIPFIIVSGTIGEERAVAAMRAGAHDYVLKDNLSRLAPAIEREVRERFERDQRRSAEASLHMQEERFRALIERSRDVVAIVGADGVVTYASPAARSLLGHELGAIVGRPFMLHVSKEHHVRVQRMMAALMQRAGATEVLELRVRRHDGTEPWVHVTATNLMDEPAIAGVVVHLHDIDEQRRAEEATRQAELALAKSDLQLRQAQKMEAIGRLAGGVAHDFNNLLSVILSYASMLLSELREDDPMATDVGEIVSAGKRAAELTRQLLLFSRQQVIQPRVADLNEIVGGMERMCRRILGEDIELVALLASDLHKVVIDPSAFEQVIMNLVVNARDAMPRGGKLTLETANLIIDQGYSQTHHGVSPGAHVRLCVSDTGCGMDAETMQHIFEPFFTTKEVGTGTGLGLSTVFGIVKQAGGTVWVYSEPDVGTTFKVLLPSVQQPKTVPRSAPPIAHLAGSESIVVVEDDPAVRLVVRGILRRNGYAVVDLGSGAEALELAKDPAVRIDLLLTDIVMPRMSGPELAQRIRELRPTLKVVCMSGYTDDAVVRHGLLDADVAFIHKPIMPETLLRKLRETLES